MTRRYGFFYLLFLLSLFYLFLKQTATTVSAASISLIRIITPGQIEKYAKFEIGFDITGSTYTNPYYPYDPATATKTAWTTFWQKAGTTGISVDMPVLLPGQTDWNLAKIQPCFYYQPMEEAGTSSSNLFLLPVGAPDWRCRYTPETTGSYQYKIRVQDSGGIVESGSQTFTAITPAAASPTRHGFVRDSQTDKRFFEFSDGTPFVWPLATYGFDVVNSVDPKLTQIRTEIPKLGNNGIRFIRWFPTVEGGLLYLFGGPTSNVWQYSGSYGATDLDTANGSLFNYKPGIWAAQYPPAKPYATYLLTARAKVTGSQMLLLGLNNAVSKYICSSTNNDPACDQASKHPTDGWYTYTLTYTTGNYSDAMQVRASGPIDPPDGSIRLGVVTLQRDESGTANCLNTNSCKWGSNILSHGDPDTYRYIDQIHAGYLDEIFRQSEQNGVYHKLTMFEKNDDILNSFDYNGNFVPLNQSIPYYFYTYNDKPVRWVENAYTRYFIARWSYSTALHSLEQANENDPGWGVDPGGEFAKYVKTVSPRNILMSNSFWSNLNPTTWTSTVYGQYLDYADKHWYADHRTAICSGSSDDTLDPCGVISSIWQDTVENVRYTYRFFRQFNQGSYQYQKPIVRGETGVAVSGTQPQDPNISLEATGIYYHKKIWTHAGILGYLADGEWYPRLDATDGSYPNANYNTYKIYKAYDNFLAGEPLNNGSHIEIGTDLTGNNLVTSTNNNIRAFGSKDPQTGRIILWVDNKNQIWTNATYNTSASSQISIAGMPAGSYTQETWNTETGIKISTNVNAVAVGTSGILAFTATTPNNTAYKDIAYKFYDPNAVIPTPTPACLLANLGDTDCNGIINISDLTNLVSHFGTGYPAADFNKDGKVNMIDMAILLKNLGKST